MLNVLQGEMSLIGPRPDFFDHARVYAEQVPGYRERHASLRLDLWIACRTLRVVLGAKGA
ncbi:sugar transferase [Rubellimicrobium rubrum]|uniref:sugar transferase n=1 Tax=Rubellimicrobium rubrum TaxID=2585369 RepID=UPI0026B3A2E3